MRILTNLSIRTKLIFLATISGCVAILLTSAAFVFNDMHVMRAAKVRQTRLHVDLMQFSQASLERSTDDNREERRVKYLNERLEDYLSRFPTITYACIYDTDAIVLATYHRDLDSDREPPPMKAVGDSFTENSELNLFHSIQHEGKHAATIFIHDDNNDVRLHFLGHLRIAMYVTIFSCLASLLMSIRLQTLIARPIQQLSDAARSIRTEENYSIRVPVSGSNEIANLYRSFNQMVERMDESEREVRETRNELESRVVERTSQLRMEVAERKKIEADLVRARDAAQESSQSKSRFLANMSHEIRTPLNAILGFSELLKKGVYSSPEEADSFLTTIVGSGHHLLELINGILDLSKIEAGQMEMEQRQFSPDHVIASALSVMSVKAAEKGLALTYDWFTGVPETILNDEARMRQALINLIGNAIKFTEAGGVHVSCQLVVDKMPTTLEVSVRDTGIGIAQDKLASVLEPFVQADASVTRRFGGTGLGLAITRRIAELLGGDLHLTSILGEGSVFTISMTTGPLDGIAIRSEPVARIESHDTKDEMARTDLTGVRILVVEDGVANRKLIRVILGRVGAEIDEAENGLAGVEKAMANDYDIILMDMQMPLMDGYQATKKLRECDYTLPIIALTANAMKGDEERCFEAGCSGYLSKPIDTNEVLSTVRDAVDRKATEAADQVQDRPAVNVFPAIQPDSRAPSAADILFGPPATRVPPALSGHASAVATPAPTQSPLEKTSPNRQLIVSSLPLDDVEFREIVVEFIDRLGLQIVELQQSAVTNDLETVERIAHMIKGTGGSAGFPVFTVPAAELMKLARDGETEGVVALVEELATIAGQLDRPASL